jgi:putative zinc finger/helix-turn-helix YgiT family protein
MKSPFTGKPMNIESELRTLTFRKESFEVDYQFFKCADTGEQFTNAALDEVNMAQLYNQYRDKHNLPFTEEIIAIRKKYALSASKMSEVLGFGPNTYRNYENGEVPNKANGNLIQMIKKPKAFKDLIALNADVDGKTKEKLLKTAEQLIIEERSQKFNHNVKQYLLGKDLPEASTGYRQPNLDKLTEMVVYFTQEAKQPFKTKMNKLLFYADFLNFTETGFGISGTRYRAIQMGPVPNNYNSLYDYMANTNAIDLCETQFESGAVGDQFKPLANRDFNKELFSPIELECLETIAQRFADTTTAQLIELSHQEPAWLKHEKQRELIGYCGVLGV